MGWNHQSTAQFVSWASSTSTVIFKWTQEIAQWVDSMVSTVENMINSAGNMIHSVGTSVNNWVSSTVQSVMQSVGQNPVVQQATHLGSSVVSEIQSAMKDAGVSGGTWLNGMEALVQHESGGNANAINPQGVNYGGGHGVEHAMGIAQMMPSTFQEYMQGSMTNILNPIDNLVASINDIKATYGSPSNIGGLFGGTYKGYASGGLLNEAVRGIGLSTGSQYMFGEAGPEYFMPARGGSASGGMAPTFNISVAVNTASSNPRQLAQQVASELTQQLKRRANLSWGV